MNNIDIENVARLRKNIFLMAYYGKTGHIAPAFSVVEMLYSLYFKGILKHNSSDSNWDDRDRLVMSKGQGALALYSVLIDAGYIKEEEKKSFARPGSILGGEPNMMDIPGVESTSGSLGHGLPFAAGMAHAFKIQKKPNKVYCIIGDGECQEGVIWEAAISSVHFKLDNLTVIMDNNRLQAMDKVENILGPIDHFAQWKGMGWDVSEIDGHDIDEITNELKKENTPGKPRIIIANTVKGKGVSFMENEPIWHFRMPNEDELKIVQKELGITDEELNS